MSRITKTIAEQVSVKLTEKKSDELKALKLTLKEKATELKIANTPKEVLNMFKKHPDYFNETCSEYFVGPGLPRYSSFYYLKGLPSIDNGVNVTTKEAEELIEIDNKIKDLKRNIDKIKQDVEVALLSLRTYNNIEKEFPEAFVHLPERTSMALAINLCDVRKQLA